MKKNTMTDKMVKDGIIINPVIDEPWVVQTECGRYQILAYEIEPVIRLEGNGERVAIARNANHFVVAVFTKVIYFARLSNFKAREETTTEDDGK
jgi:hypothetical protein